MSKVFELMGAAILGFQDWAAVWIAASLLAWVLVAPFFAVQDLEDRDDVRPR